MREANRDPLTPENREFFRSLPERLSIQAGDPPRLISRGLPVGLLRRDGNFWLSCDMPDPGAGRTNAEGTARVNLHFEYARGRLAFVMDNMADPRMRGPIQPGLLRRLPATAEPISRESPQALSAPGLTRGYCAAVDLLNNAAHVHRHGRFRTYGQIVAGQHESRIMMEGLLRRTGL